MEPSFRKVIARLARSFTWAVTFLAVGLVLVTLVAAVARADCGHFFRKQVVYQQYVAPVYAAPIVYAAPVYYSAGLEYQIQAEVEKALRLREQAPTKGYQSQVQAPIQAPIQAPHAKGSLEPLQSVEVGLFARCIRCHRGENAKAGLRFDGDYPTTHENYARFGRIFALGEIPPEMASVVPQVTAEQRGEMNEWILRRVVVQPVQPAPPVDRPPPAPVPEGGGLQ